MHNFYVYFCSAKQALYRFGINRLNYLPIMHTQLLLKSVFAFIFVIGFQLLQAQENKELPKLGSSDEAENRESIDDSVKVSVFDLPVLNPYFNFKKKVYNKTGLRFNFDYNSLYMGSNAEMGKGHAAGGVFRFYGNWDILGRKSGNTGSFIYKIEHRHKYSSIPVIDLSMDMGNVGIYGVTFNNDHFRVTNLYWKQKLLKGRLYLIGGFLDATNFFDVYGMGNPWTHFNNLNFTTGISAASLPGDGYLGFSVEGWLTKHIYAIAGFGDQNSDPTLVFRGFETFFREHEFFKHAEIGFTKAKKYVYLDNIHLSFWHRDNNKTTGTGWGWGFVFSATKYVYKKWLPFFRFAYTEKGESLLEMAVSTGLGYQRKPDGHQAGIAFSWGRPNADTFRPGLSDQFTTEAFYRLQFSRRLALTPGIMYIIDPALNPNEHSIFLWSIRARIAL